MSNEPPTMESPVEELPEEQPLDELLNRLERENSTIMREKLPRLRALLDKELTAQRTEHEVRLADLGRQLTALRNELEEHLVVEEREVFPHVRDLLRAADEGTEKPEARGAEIQELHKEHQTTLQAIDEIRRLGAEYDLPEDAGEGLREFYDELADLEDLLVRHLETEEEALFPRIAEMERGE
jgi:iron-sulfur cluster repair protein YtfE (RIC family)